MTHKFIQECGFFKQAYDASSRKYPIKAPIHFQYTANKGRCVASAHFVTTDFNPLTLRVDMSIPYACGT